VAFPSVFSELAAARRGELYLVRKLFLGVERSAVGPTGREYLDQVYPTAFYAVKNGRKKDLLWRLDRD